MGTIKDVATRAGVSISTVSRILNGDNRVKPETLEKVRAAADELGYVPSALGRGLRRQSLAVWALIVGDVENPLFTGATRGVEDVAREAGFSVLLCNSDEHEERERDYLAIALQMRVSGVVITPTSSSVDVGPLLRAGIPVVSMDRPVEQDGVMTTDTVLVDTRSAARRAVTALIGRGATRIACVTGDPHIYTTAERVEGYRNAIRSAGLQVDEALIRYTNLKVDGGRDATRDLLAHSDIDGIITTNSLMTVGALEAVKLAGRTIGDDLQFATFDDAPWTSLLHPAIVRVSQPAYQLGEDSARLLLSRIERSSSAPRSVQLQATVRVPKGGRRGGGAGTRSRDAATAPSPER